MVANAKVKTNKGIKGELGGAVATVRKSEFIQNIVTPTSDGFSVQKFEINPGLDSFPWVKQIAPSFTKYKLKEIRFRFETAVSTFSPGMVMMAPQFNVSKSVPDTKTQFLELAYAARGPIWKNFSLEMGRSATQIYKEYFVRQEPVTELKLYDPFYLVVATDSVDLDRPYIGELWIDYELDLYEPVYVNPREEAYGNYGYFTTGLINNQACFTNRSTITGGLQIRFDVDNKTLIFEEDFTGMIMCVINQANLGLADQLYDGAGLEWTLASDSGAVQGTVGVGGNGYSANNQGYTLWTIGLSNFIVGDRITFDTAGFYATTPTTSANSSQWYVMKGIDFFIPPVPEEIDLEVEQFLRNLDKVGSGNFLRKFLSK